MKALIALWLYPLLVVAAMFSLLCLTTKMPRHWRSWLAAS